MTSKSGKASTVKNPKKKKDATTKVVTPKAKAPEKTVPPKDDYEGIRSDVEKPTAERSQIETRRGNMRVPRRYHLTQTKMDRLLEQSQKTGGFPNPYRKGGIYHAIVSPW